MTHAEVITKMVRLMGAYSGFESFIRNRVWGKNIIRGTTEGHDIMMKTMGIWMEQSVFSLRPAIQFRKVLQAFI